jgi:hypothetical protein
LELAGKADILSETLNNDIEFVFSPCPSSNTAEHINNEVKSKFFILIFLYDVTPVSIPETR